MASFIFGRRTFGTEPVIRMTWPRLGFWVFTVCGLENSPDFGLRACAKIQDCLRMIWSARTAA